jgi:adenosylcobinamide-phosphate synthase
MAAATGLLGGWLVDRAVGDPVRRHPVAAFGRLAAAVEQRCWRDDRLTGAGYTAALAGAVTALAWAADRVVARRPVARAGVLAAVLATSMGGRSLASEARGVAGAVRRGELVDARARLPALCGRDPAGLDGQGLCAAAIESVAENGADAVVAPLWWAAIAGTPGVAAHRAANTLDAMVGHRSLCHARFGWCAARLDDGLGWAPARLTAALLAAAAPVAGGRPSAAWSAWRRDGQRHASPNAGPCEAAMAGALGVTLGGRHAYPAGTIRAGEATGAAGARRDGWTAATGPFGDGPAPTPDDVDRAVALMLTAGAAAAVLCAALAAVRTAPAGPPTARTAPAAARTASAGPLTAPSQPGDGR